jgi:hypothetical protein
MASPQAHGVPSPCQKKAIMRMLKGDPGGNGILQDKQSIIEGLVAAKIILYCRDELSYLRDTNFGIGTRPDLVAALRMYETFSREDMTYLGSLADEPLPTVLGWVEEIGKSVDSLISDGHLHPT